MAEGERGGWHLLGPVQLIGAAGEIDLGSVKQRCLVAVLLMSPGRPVPVGTLIDRIWDDQPPRSDKALAPYASRLRRVLAGAEPDFDPGTVRFSAGGYVLDCAPDRVDLHRARRTATAARAAGARGDHERAAELIRQALDDWQPVALAGLDSRWATRTADALARERLDLIAQQAQFDLRLGRHTVVIEDLRTPVAEHPIVERLVEALLVALTRAGRLTEALSLYEQHRQAIAEELGATPSPALADLHLRILRNDRTLADPVPRAAKQEREVHRPFQLPADVPAFTGRIPEMRQLETHLGELLDRANGSAGSEVGVPEPMVISAVSGMAGVGKTALAIRWAHRVRDRFPDGQLYVNLRGYDPDQPMSVTDVLARFLVAVGVPESDVPPDLETRVARYRTETSDRRLLVLLDNASSVDQVRPLLPGSSTCLVLVTSRDSLAGLVAVNGARRIQLGLLPADEATALLRRLIGDRVDADPAAATALAEQCARLPLALRVAAERAVAQEHAALADLVDDLADQQHRLELLDAGGDSRSAVAAVFSWSLRPLSRDLVRIFALLGLHPGPTFEAHAVAALADVPLAEAGRALDRLGRAHLVQPLGADRFGMHDLLRTYAVSLVPGEAGEDQEQGTASVGRAALSRLFDFYGTAVEWAAYRVNPFDVPPPSGRPVAAPLPELDDLLAADQWLAAERTVLQAMATHTATHGWIEHCLRLSGALFQILLRSGAYADALVIHGAASEAAIRSGDKAGQAQVLSNLGATHLNAGRLTEAHASLDQAATLFASCGDVTRLARTLARLGAAEMELGRDALAFEHLQKALALLEERGEANDVELFQAKMLTRVNLGYAESRLGRGESATRHLLAARMLCEPINDEVGVAWTADAMGEHLTRFGRRDEAAEHHREALAIFRAFEHHDGELSALNGLGEAAAPIDAIGHHQAALAIAVPAQARVQQARAHLGLARAYRALADPAQARQQYRRAIDLYATAGMPLADEARAEIAALD